MDFGTLRSCVKSSAIDLMLNQVQNSSNLFNLKDDTNETSKCPFLTFLVDVLCDFQQSH